MMFKTETSLKNLLTVYILWIALSAFSASLVYLYFKDAGVSESELVASFFFSVISTVLVILLLSKSKIEFRKLMAGGSTMLALAYVSLAYVTPTRELLFLYSAVVGLNFFLFWAPFNIMYFEFGRTKAALFGTFYFSLTSVAMMVLPLLSGFIAQNIGFGFLFLLSAIMYLLLTVPVYLLHERSYKYTVRESIKDTKGFKTLLFIEGVYGGGMMAALSVIPLFYFEKPMEMAFYLSITTIFSVIASFIVSNISDKSKRRIFYIRIFGAGLALTTMASSLATTVGTWYTAVSSRNFFSTLFQPFTTAIITDTKKDLANVMIGRELILNVGRIFGVASVFVCTVAFSNIYISLAFLGLIILLYPFVIELKRKHLSVI